MVAWREWVLKAITVAGPESVAFVGCQSTMLFAEGSFKGRSDWYTSMVATGCMYVFVYLKDLFILLEN